tara:strand:+ start:405 stop:1769 length:1365 start_codon:yes stop_codon:yes gene_type:complete
MADIAQNSGALSLLGGSLDNNEEPDPIALYQLQAQSPEIGGGQKLQDVYGTSSMPVFEWVKSIQSGERTYNPADSFDQQKAEEYRQLQQTNPELPEIPGIGDIAKGLAAPIGGMVAERITQAAFDPLVQNMSGNVTKNVLSAAGESFLPEFMGGTGQTLPSQATADATSAFLNSGGKAGVAGLKASLGKNSVFYPELASESIAQQTGNIDLFRALTPTKTAQGNLVYNPVDVFTQQGAGQPGNLISSGITSSNITSVAADNSYMSGVSEGLFGEGMQSTWTSAGINAVVQFGIGVMQGQDPVTAAKTAGASAIGGAIGAQFGGPIGAIIGSQIGARIGSRVICNELQRQGLMTREQVLLDYRFTRDYLTPAHVNGYHYWAIHVVRQLRKGKRVTLWKHIATHRSNEIAYIYGKREKPDYLGKVYRYATEPLCWVIGKLKNKESDWSVLYKPKEI